MKSDRYSHTKKVYQASIFKQFQRFQVGFSG